VAKPDRHGSEHRPGGFDPSYTGPWHYVGALGEPAFQSGWVNVGGGLAALRFRLLVGSPADDGDSIDDRGTSLEIQGSVTGGDSGTVVFTLPEGYRPSHELRLPASDDSGGFVVLKVEANGDVSRGLA
jgi:hypothetical protein